MEGGPGGGQGSEGVMRVLSGGPTPVKSTGRLA